MNFKILLRFNLMIMIFFCFNCYGNKDSLEYLIETSVDDQEKLEALHKLIWQYELFSDSETAFELASEQLLIAEKNDNKNFVAKAYNTQGVSWSLRGNPSKAIKYYERSIAIREEINDSLKVANGYGNLGLAYKQLGNYIVALEWFSKSINRHSLNNNKLGMSKQYNNIGLIHHEMNENKEAIVYFNKALSLINKTDHPQQFAISTGNLALAYLNLKQDSLAIKNFKESIHIQEGIQDLNGIVRNLVNMSFTQSLDDDEKLSNLTRAIKISKKREYNDLLSFAYVSLSKYYIKKKKFKQAVKYADMSLELANDVQQLKIMRDAHQVAYEANKSLGNLPKSLENLELFHFYNDTLNKKQNKIELIKQEYKIAYEQKQIQDDLQHKAELLTVENEKMKQRYISYGLIISLIVIGSFLIFSLRSLKKIKLQKKQLKIQSDELLESQKNNHNLQLKHSETTLLHKQKDLERVKASNRIKLLFKKDILEKLKKIERSNKSKASLKSLILEIAQQIQTDEKIDLFEDKIYETDFAFNERIIQKHPELTKSELELCSFIRLNLTIKEIASLKGVSANSIAVMRSRLRSKLNLERNTNLENHIREI